MPNLFPRTHRDHLPADLRRLGARLLHAQCWAWGQDVKRPAGNLLLEYGFERMRPPAEVAGCSQYTLLLPPGLTLRIWGFGVFVGGQEGLYLNRFEFTPRHACGENQWTPGRLARGRRCLDRPLLHTLLCWLGEYERWVEGVAGSAYRQGIFAGWPAADDLSLHLATDWLAFRDLMESRAPPRSATTP